jgi:hypothetical protein
MASTTVQQISKEDIKQAILSLIKENNAEFRHLIAELLPKIEKPVKRKTKKNAANFSPIQHERIPHSEMSFWKSHPHLNPQSPEEFGAKPVSLETIQALQNLFQQPDCPPIEEWVNNLD